MNADLYINVYRHIIYTHTNIYTYVHNKYRHVRMHLPKYIPTVIILQLGCEICFYVGTRSGLRVMTFVDCWMD